MKSLIAAVIASAFSLGAIAQTAAPMASASAPMAASSDMKKPMAKKHVTKKRASKKSKMAASAPAA